ncbi:MAG: TIGR03086 family metal-binding protein [Acidimicrobiales bacterium]
MSTEWLEKAFGATRSVLSNVKEDQYADPTPCASWTVRDLVNHIVEGANWSALCVDGGGAPDPDPTHGVDYAAGDVVASYDQGASASLAAFGAPGAGERVISLPFGELPGAMFLGIATNDVVTHGWDLATATGQTLDVDPEVATGLLAHMRNVADALRGPDGQGAWGPEVEVGPDASPIERLVAYLGRRP